jgi:zinc transport system ATP-binding protein
VETAALEFQGVSFSYGDVHALKNATFKIASNQFTGVIGPNGGGKTTLLKLAMGLLEPDTGTIQVFGQTPSLSQGDIAYVPQTLHYDRLFPISVRELVLMGRLSHLKWWGSYSAEDEEAALAALKTVGLDHLLKVPVGNLSGGQFQRALIARALASEPKILFLDEPTSNVDTKAESDIYDLLKKLAKTMTIVMVTHNLNTAVQIVDQVLIVHGTVNTMKVDEVCEHFALGLYHTPLVVHLNEGKK